MSSTAIGSRSSRSTSEHLHTIFVNSAREKTSKLKTPLAPRNLFLLWLLQHYIMAIFTCGLKDNQAHGVGNPVHGKARLLFSKHANLQNGGIYTEAREQLLQTLPKSVDPVIFPPITVSPDQLVTHLTQINVNREDRSTLRSHIRTMLVSA